MKTKFAYLILFFLLTSTVSYSQTSVLKTTAVKAESSKKAEARYFYYPNLQAYFDTQTNLFLFRVNKQWISAESFPENYGGYSLYNNHRVKIDDYFGDDITELLAIHKILYPYNSKGRLKKEDS